MELRDDEDIEVFAVEAENGGDGAADEEETAAMSTEKNRLRRPSDMIDSMGGDENIFPEKFSTPRRASDRSTDLTSPDQGYSDTPKLSTPDSVHFFVPDWIAKASDVMDGTPMGAADFAPSSVTETLMTVDMDAECYKMDHKNRGKCVVFNHDKFDTGFPPRVGSSVDAKKIETTFHNLGFEVEIHDNFTHTEIMNKLAQLSAEDHRDADCLCVFVLTHGLSNDLICAKDVAYNSANIWKPFTADLCATLAGKPKMFFFQACRGTELDAGVLMSRTAMLRTETDTAALSYKLPTHADFLIAHSCVQGFFSWRSPDEGTWFVQSLCQVLDQHGHNVDLLRMMTITARKIATTRSSYDNINPDNHDKKQMPSVTSMLLRDVYFTPKPKPEID